MTDLDRAILKASLALTRRTAERYRQEAIETAAMTEWSAMCARLAQAFEADANQLQKELDDGDSEN